MVRRTAQPTAKAVAFFQSNSPRRRGEDRRLVARHLAKAEAEASARGWRCEWEGDPDIYDPRCEDAEMLGAVLRDERGRVLAARWGICDPDRAQRRVIEAQLALEALKENG